jgi:hypothetical protein
MSDGAKGRRRRSSSVLIYKEPPESPEQLSDQSALPNLNASWVNSKGENTPFLQKREKEEKQATQEETKQD